MTPFDEHVRLAQAMLHGHLYIDPAPPWMEHITVNGHDYILHGPLSAFICLPFVAVGITDQRLLCLMLGVVSTVLCYRLTRSGWLTAFFVCGTTFLYECSNGASWDFALVATTPFTFGAIIATKGLYEQRQFLSDDDSHQHPHSSRYDLSAVVRISLVGLSAGLAALARYDLMLAWPVYLWIIWRKDNETLSDSGYRIANSIRCLGPMVCVLVVYIWFNEARFGTLTDGSVSEWYWHYDQFRAQRPYGPFSVHYLPVNLYTLLWMAPQFQGGFPWLRPQFTGQALLSLSPAFLMARFSPWLAAAALASLPALTVYASGFSQLGCRYYVQVFPFLIASMMPKSSAPSANGPTPISVRSKAFICASIFLSMSATLIVWTYGLA